MKYNLILLNRSIKISEFFIEMIKILNLVQEY